MLDETYKKHKYFMSGIDLSHLVIIDTIDNKIVIYNRNKNINKYTLNTYYNMYPDLNTNCPNIDNKYKINILHKDIFNIVPYFTIYHFKSVYIPDIVSNNINLNIINDKKYYECDYNIQPQLKGVFILVNIGNGKYICIDDGICFITLPDNENINYINIYNFSNNIYPYAYSKNYGYNLYNMTYFDIKYLYDSNPIKFTNDGMKYLITIKRRLLKNKKVLKVIKPYNIIHKYL